MFPTYLLSFTQQKSHFCSMSHCPRTSNMGSPRSDKSALEPSMCPCDHDAFYIWGRRESLVIFDSYGVQIHTALFPNDLQRSKARKTDRDRDGQRQRDRHIVRKTERERKREKRKVSQILLSCNSLSIMPSNSHDAMKLWPRNIFKWQEGFSLQHYTHILSQ